MRHEALFVRTVDVCGRLWMQEAAGRALAVAIGGRRSPSSPCRMLLQLPQDASRPMAVFYSFL